MTLPIKEHIPRMVCTDDRLKRLRTMGIKTDGYVYSLEEIITSRGFGLPSKGDEDSHCGFTINFKYSYLFMNYADCLAEEIFALDSHGLWKNDSEH